MTMNKGMRRLASAGVMFLMACGVACSREAPGQAPAATPAPDTPATTPAPSASTKSAATSGLVSKRVSWANDTWIPVGLESDGIQIKEVRFAVEGGIHWNPLRAGIGPQAFLATKNISDHGMRFAVAIAMFDASGALIGASEATHTGTLDPAETADMKLTFREVKRRFFEAKTAQIALETWK